MEINENKIIKKANQDKFYLILKKDVSIRSIYKSIFSRNVLLRALGKLLFRFHQIESFSFFLCLKINKIFEDL